MIERRRETMVKLVCLTALLLNFSLFGLAQQTLISEMDQLQWQEILPGIWKATFGEPGLNPLDYSSPPRVKALEDLGSAVFPFQEADTRSQITPERAIIRMPLAPTERIYGLGLEFTGINRREQVYTLKVDHYGGVKGYTHAPVPFYVSSKGYGVLINSAERVKIYVGVGNRKDSKKPDALDRTTDPDWSALPLSDAVEASVAGEGMEVYVFSGKTLLEVVQRYNLFCGGGILPPKWGLGFWHRMNTISAADDVLQEVDSFQKYKIPLDVIGLEPGWQDFAYPCSYDWDTTRFPDPRVFVTTLQRQGIQVNLWENPYVATTSTMYQDISPYTGSHTVWLGEVPDYTLREAQKVLLDHHQKNHLSLGVSGYKIDEVDGFDRWLWPDHATFPSGTDAVQLRQTYGLIMQEMLGTHFRDRNIRTYGLVRASYIGASSKPFVIYSDHYDHKGYVTALVNSSLSGLLWTPEIRSAESAEEWVRRFQTVCFSPLMQLNAWASSKKPWSFAEVTEIVRDHIELRARLLPYLYTAFYDYQLKGIPPFRAMVLEEGLHAETFAPGSRKRDQEDIREALKKMEVTDQYMMGPSILVAPVFTGQTERKVMLPPGKWYDFYTGKLVGEGGAVTIQTQLERIPLLVKDGAIIPMLSEVTEDGLPVTLQLRHYGSKDSQYVLYNDDGKTFDYEKGDNTLLELKAVKGETGMWKGDAKFLNNQIYQYGEIEWIWM